MSDVNHINISLLKSYKQDFNSEINNFNNKSYNTFSSSYINKCSDSYVTNMARNLNNLYKNIQKGYTNIDKWWSAYNDNVENLEKSLASGSDLNSVSESSIRSAINSLPELKDYNIEFSGIINLGSTYSISSIFANTSINSDTTSYNSISGTTVNNDVKTESFWDKVKGVYSEVCATVSNFGSSVVDKVVGVVNDVSDFYEDTKATIVESATSAWDKITNWWDDTTDSVVSFAEDVGATISNGFNSVIDTVGNWWDDVTSWWTDDAVPWIENAASAVWDVVKSVGADIAVFVQSLVEGVLEFGEALVDFVALVGTGVASIGTGLYDAGQAIYGAITGNEWSSATKAMWNGTMGFVCNNYVSGWFDLLYENTGYGKWLSENAYGFDTVRSVGSGIGYIAGIVILTIATFGAGSAVATVGGVTSAGVSAGVTVGTAAASVTGATVTITTSALGAGAIATAAGIGKNTAVAWNDGASILQGLGYGTAMGAWEGLEMTFGYVVNGLKILKGTGLTSQLVNSLSHVVLDAFDGATSTGTSSLLQMIYNPNESNMEEIMKFVNYDSEGNKINNKTWEELSFLEKWNALFEYNGGWASVKTGAVTAGAFSFLSEVPDIFKVAKGASIFESIFGAKNAQVDIDNISPEIKEIMLEMDDTFADKNFAEVLEELISKEKNAQGKVAGSVLFDKLDYNSTPKLVSADEFDNLLQTSKGKVMFRGISGEDSLKYVEQFQTGDLYVGGGRGAIHGTGIYTAYGDTGLSVVQDYMSAGGTSTGGSVMKMLLDDDAKVIAYDVIEAEKEQILDAMAQRFRTFNDKIVDFNSLQANLDSITSITDLNQAKYIVNTLNDTGYYAALRGYDAIDVPDKEFMVLLNRGKVTMVADSAVLLKEQFKTLNDVEISEMISTSKNQSEIFENLDPSRIENSKILSLEKQLFEEAEAKGMTLKELGSQKGGTSIDPQLQSQADQLANKVRQVAIDAEPKITADMRLLEGDNATLVGLDYRLKGQDSLSRKILSDSVKDGVSMDVAASKIGDSVRYTLLIDEASYVDQIQHNLDYLTEQGYTIKKFKNFWGGDIYQGVNTSIVSPDGVTFELQFHTKVSFSTKESLNHLYYEIARNDFTSDTQKSLANQIMQINQSAVVVPEEILGYNYLLNVSELSSDAVSSLSSPQIRKMLLKMDDAQRYQMVNNLTDIQLKRFALKSDGALADIVWLMDDNKFVNFLSSVSSDSVALKNVLSLSQYDRIINSLKLISDDSVTRSIVDSFDSAQIRYIFSNADTDTLTRVIKYCTDENIASAMGYLTNPNTVLSLLDDKTFVNVVSKTDGLYLHQLVRNLNDTQLKVLLSSEIDTNTYARILQELSDMQLNDALSKGLIRDLPEKFYVAVDLDVTAKALPVSTLIDIIQNDESFKMFVRQDYNPAVFGGFSREEIAQAFEQFSDAINKNGYNFGFSFIQNARIENIVKNFKPIPMTPRMRAFNSWADSVMTDNFRREFGGIVSDTKFDKLKGTYVFLEEADFKQKTTNPKSMAFNNGDFSTMNLAYSDEIVKANVSHESIHQLSNSGLIVLDDGTRMVKAGVCLDIFDPNTNSWISKYNGLNETFTEYLNELSLKHDYPIREYCGYQPAVRRLKELLNLGIEGLDNSTIKKSYFGNDLSQIRSIINLVAGDNSYFDSTFASAFDEAIDGNTHNLDKVVKMLIFKHKLGG